MTLELAYISLIPSLLVSGLLVWFGLWLHRLKLNIRSLPWAAIYFGLSFVFGFITPYMLQLIADSGNLGSGRGAFTLLSQWRFASGALRGIGRLILFAMLISELAPLLARSSPVTELQSWEPLRKVRENIPLLGFVAVATLLIPIAVSAIMLSSS